jgi:hypothetical protein
LISGVNGPRRTAGLVRSADRDDRDPAGLRSLAQAFEVEDPVDAGEPDVEQDRVGTRLDEHPLGLDHVVGRADLESLQLECRTDQLAEQPVVVDDQDPRCATHFRTP